MKSFVAYYRVSTRAQSKSGLGLDAQKALVRTFVANEGQIAEEFVEVESGRRDERIQLARAMTVAKKTSSSLVIARLDRFSRRVSFIASVMESGVQLIIAEMPHATEFQLHIFAALAQEERRLISVRTKAALAQAKMRGTVLGSNGRVLAQRNKDAADNFAKSIATHLPSDWPSRSYAHLARYLNDQGVKTMNGKRFFPQTVKGILARL